MSVFASLTPVSACHGLHPSPDYPQGDPDGPGCYTSWVKSWVQETFPGVSGCLGHADFKAEHEFLNGAIGGMDSRWV